MSKVFDYLFGAASFIPHGYCLSWRPDLVAMHADSDGVIALSYFSIPFALIVFLKRRTDLEFRRTFGLFALFIFACGVTHFTGLITLWAPYYGIQGLVKLSTAMISVMTAISLWPLLPKALALPGPAQLREINSRLAAEISEKNQAQIQLRQAYGEMESKVIERTRELQEAYQRLQEDLQRRTALEQELGESRERYDRAVAGTNDGIWDWHLPSGQVYYSPVWMKILGHETEELPHALSTWEKRVHPDDLRGAHQRIQAHLSGETEIYSYDHRMRHKSGDYIWIHAKGTVVRDGGGNPVRLAGTISDITTNKNYEEALQESEAQMRAVIETAVDGVIIIQSSGTIRMYNPACERLFGYNQEEIIGRNVNTLMPAPYRKEHDGYLDQYRETGERKVIGIRREVTGQRKDGTIFPMELSVGETRRDGKQVFVGVVRDVTERKEIEEALVQKAQELTATNAELERFAYVASHDLQEPLRKIQSFADLLQSEYGDSLPADAVTYVRIMHDAAGRMNKQTKDLLTLSRLSWESTEFEPVNLATLLEQARFDLKERI